MTNHLTTYACNLFYGTVTTVLLSASFIGCAGVALYTGKSNPEGFQILEKPFGMTTAEKKYVYVPNGQTVPNAPPPPPARGVAPSEGQGRAVAQNNVFGWNSQNQAEREAERTEGDFSPRIAVEEKKIYVDPNGNVLSTHTRETQYGGPADVVTEHHVVRDPQDGTYKDNGSIGFGIGKWTILKGGVNWKQERSKDDKKFQNRTGIWPEDNPNRNNGSVLEIEKGVYYNEETNRYYRYDQRTQKYEYVTPRSGNSWFYAPNKSNGTFQYNR